MVDGDELEYYREWVELVKGRLDFTPAKERGQWVCELNGAKYSIPKRKTGAKKEVGSGSSRDRAVVDLFHKVAGRPVELKGGEKYNTPFYVKPIAFNRSKENRR